ncbi:trans-2,3-dihydro-3-hydroxyanthranilate isomerase [Alkaliphilus hydrothermalis]|uniref:Trans-2,3-dihydro-3-hydroxyanthranilate isomerase n=2 Tax=Alkaliphilus hydrothermalis TaxID=1482730 RepID=A0ABS2NM97_9FIRM|nr:trans-2,3-dihydro-3-hydroxyanthranilate isomerase [Alkaliphilus hydrothermalis]
MDVKMFYVVNAFSNKPFQGNPAGVVLDANKLEENKMQDMARQLNLVETVFVYNPTVTDKYDFELRYFTPLKEVPIAGHPTIATFIALEVAGRININQKQKYVIKTKAGLREIRMHKDNGETVVTMQSPKPIFYPEIKDRYEVAEVLGLRLEDLIPDLPVQPVDTGLGHLIVPVRSMDALMKVERNINPLRHLCSRFNMREAQVFTFETYEKKKDIHTRNICPREGIEDPACGLGNAALGAYLLKNKYPKKKEILLKSEQGKIINMPCVISIHASKVEDDMQILVGGKGRVMIKGEFYI